MNMKLQFFVLLQIVTFTVLCSAGSNPSRTKAAQVQIEEQGRTEEELRIERKHYPKVFTRNGAQCVFPFKYKDELYFGCTSLNIPLRKTRVNTKYPGKKWCQTVYEVKSSLEIPAQGGDDQDSTWGYCQNSKNLTAVTITYSGQECAFPFRYKGVRYFGCTTFDHPRHKSWCFVKDPITHGPSQQKEKDLCRDSRNAEIDTYGGTGRGLPCKFPFTKKNRVHYGCSNDDDGWGQYRCPTEDGWGYCNIIDTETNLIRLRSEIGNIYNKTDCVFPFIYEKKKQYGCIGSTPWCATTYNYDKDGEYRYCDNRDILGVASRKRDTTSEFHSCTFPFILNGTLWSQLVLNPYGDAVHKDIFVCPSLYNIGGDERLVPGWKNMKIGHYRTSFEWVPSQVSIGVANNCPNPWYHDNIQYHGCAIGIFHDWCSSTSNFDGSSGWLYCSTLDKMKS